MKCQNVCYIHEWEEIELKNKWILKFKESFIHKLIFTQNLPSGHPKCKGVCFFIWTDLKKFSIISLAHQWILCSEWVPSEWAFHFIRCWLSKVVLWIIVIFFISRLDSHSDGTHSLQRIHWWASDIMLHFFKSVQMKKQTPLHFGWPEGKFWVNINLWMNDSFKPVVFKPVLQAPLPCTFCMSPLLDTQFRSWCLYLRADELNQACPIRKTYKMCRAGVLAGQVWKPLL